MRYLVVLILVLLFNVLSWAGPYAEAGMGKDDPNFIFWAAGVTIERGFQDINDQSRGYASYGSETNALGLAEGTSAGVVSLGDGGAATVTFGSTIYVTNGAGNDFAVFENGFSSGFLELGFVEVSSDGNNFFGFDSVSLTPTNKQVGGFDALDATNIHNLAGKYMQGVGTQFDLEELKDVNSLLDVNSITHIRITDVVGYVEPADFYCDGVVNFIDYMIFAAAYPSKQGDERWNEDCDISDPPDGIIDSTDFEVFAGKWLEENVFSSCDSNGHQINDPWSTPFSSGGFDLDAVGVINARVR